MKKLCSFILIVVISVNLTQGVTVSAASKYDPSKMTMAEYVIAHMNNFEKEIELIYYLKSFKYDADKLIDEFYSIVDNHPELFQFDGYENDSYDFYSIKSYDDKTKKTIYSSYTVEINNYLVTKSEYKKKLAEMDKAAEKALQYAANCSTDMEKALAIHDYIALNTEYDHEATESPVNNKANNYKYSYAYNAYGALVNKSAVCSGYTQAYIYLMKKLGIDCAYVSSSEMNHAWNYAKIDGKWYHVDITWDDPSFDGNDLLGSVYHEFFLLSDGEMKKREHYGWVVEGNHSKANSTKYNNYFWNDIKSPIIKLGNYWYYTEIDENSPKLNDNYNDELYDELYKDFYNAYTEPYYNGEISEVEYDELFSDFFDEYYDLYEETNNIYTNIIKRDISTGKKTPIHTFASTWYNYDNGNYYSETYSGLALYNDRFYYNTAEEIYSINSSGGNAVLVSKPTNLKGYIYGMIMNDNKITYTVKSNPSAKDSLKTKTIKAVSSTKITLNAKSGSSQVGKSKSLKATVSPSSSNDYVY